METTSGEDFEEGQVNENTPKQEESAPTVNGSLVLELGDIIEIVAPTNPDIHEATVMIQYIDDEKIHIINAATNKRYLLRLNADGRFSDESITQIYLLDRSEEKGYARQNGLLPRAWVDVYFLGEVPMVISGEITNLEEDMVEITTFPELRTIYIDFGYKGLPENIPIEKIIIREKPASLKNVGSLAILKSSTEEGEIIDPENLPQDEIASMEFTESGESIISIPEGAVPDKDIRENLRELYIDANSVIFGETLEEIAQLVEVPEEKQRFGIDVQVNDLMDELLSTIPNSQRTKLVLDNIHLLIERFKQLRSAFSNIDGNDNVYGAKTVGAFYKPLIQRIEKMDTCLRWLVPVVSARRKLYNEDIGYKPSDVTINNIGGDLRDLEKLMKKTNELPYVATQARINEFFAPVELPTNPDNCLATMPVLTNLDTIVSNLENFGSSVFKNGSVLRSEYVIQRYNLGSSYMKDTLLKSGKTIYTRAPMGGNDKICLKSVLMLPQPVVQFSRIGLPMSSILDKATLHQNYFLLYKLFNTARNNKNIITHVIDDLTKELDYEKMEKEEKIEFLSGIHEYILDTDIADVEQYDNDEKFNKFLEAIVPKTRILIRLVRKYIKDDVSFVDIVRQLEPFMIYSSDITYNQYKEIRYLIKTRMTDFRKEFQKASENFAIIRNTNYNTRTKPITILRVLSENSKFSDVFFETYKIIAKDNTYLTKESYMTNGSTAKMSSQEILSRIIQTDSGNLYCNIITSILISLITPSNLMDELTSQNIDDMTDNERIKPTDCTKRYLAKKYKSLKELQKDNNEPEVYFDKELDDTPYNIIKLYEKERKDMSPDLFLEFLETSLVKKHSCPKEVANSLAAVLIAGKRAIKDGEYAIVEVRPTLPEGIDESLLTDDEKQSIQIESDARKKVLYYRRLKNNWINDDTISESAFTDTNTLFCNISNDCTKNTSNGVCESVLDTEKRIKEITKKRMLSEFDRRYEISAEELEVKLDRTIEKHLASLVRTQRLKEIKLHKMDNLAGILGTLANKNEFITSPYLRLRDLILEQDDFSKKQYDITRFVEKYGRDPLPEQAEESAFWKYCKETNTKLFPLSLFQLAEAFVLGDDYPRKLDKVIATFGVISDDGDSIVDKYSGFVLRKIDFSSEEGFDDAGFRITTNDILEKDLGTVVMEAIGKKEKPVFENPTTEVIYNIYSTVCSNIGIPVDRITDFVLRNSTKLIEKYVWKEEIYKKKSADQEKKTGKPFSASYKNYRNESIISITTSVLLVGIQTAAPSFQAKKTYPGCVKSFSGYPLDGVEDLTGIKYMACVLNKTKSSIEPWSSIEKYKVDALTKRMKEIIENQVLSLTDIPEMYTEKRNYMLLNPDKTTVDEHSIQKWQHFLPPVVQFEVSKGLRNVPSDFKSDFIKALNDGSRRQDEIIGTLKGKIIQYGYGLNEIIDTIVTTKELLLKTQSGIPFTENACCNDKQLTNPITYFNEEDNNIALYLRIVNQLVSILDEAKSRSRAGLIYHPGQTGISYPTVPLGYLEDDIYAAIMKYCNFDRNLPVPEIYKTICSEKPPQFNPLLSFRDKVDLLKRNGKQYGIDALNNLMQIVRQKNIVDIDIPKDFTKLDIFKEVVENLDMSDSKIIDSKLREHLSNVMEKHNPKQMLEGDTKELDGLKRYLSRSNRDMYNEIINFFGQYGNLSENDYDYLHKFLTNINKWNLDQDEQSVPKTYYDEGIYKITQFLQNAVHNISKVYPAILMNDATFFKNVPKHWGLSDDHEDDVSKFVQKYYEKIEKFKGDTTLMRLLNEVSEKLVDLNRFLQNVPVHTDIIKSMIGENDKPEVHRFYSLFDKQTIYMLYSYCFYSVIFEYIHEANDPEMLKTDLEEMKLSRRAKIGNAANPSNLIQSSNDDITELNEDYNSELREIRVSVGNVLELKQRVCELLLTFLEVEQTNKDTLDFSYEQVIKRVSRSKEKEKRGIVEKLGKMTIEERGVENMLKNYRLGRWNVGQQKGLFMYDQSTYDRERSELIAQIMGETQDGAPDIVSEEQMDIYELEIRDKNAEEVDVDKEMNDIGDLGQDFMDGVVYEEDRGDVEDEY
jgi:hypothetical protein